MTENEVQTLRSLLQKYFKAEFEMYKNSYNLVHGDKHIEDEEPESLFISVLNNGHPYREFLKRMENDIMEHIKHVFILEFDPQRFEKV